MLFSFQFKVIGTSICFDSLFVDVFFLLFETEQGYTTELKVFKYWHKIKREIIRKRNFDTSNLLYVHLQHLFIHKSSSMHYHIIFILRVWMVWDKIFIICFRATLLFRSKYSTTIDNSMTSAYFDTPTIGCQKIVLTCYLSVKRTSKSSHWKAWNMNIQNIHCWKHPIKGLQHMSLHNCCLLLTSMLLLQIAHTCT